MLQYPVNLRKDDGETWVVTVPDFPEAHTFGDSKADALARAADAIASAMQGRIGDRKIISPPSPRKRGQYLVAIPAVVTAKLALYRAMLEARITKAALARRLGMHPPQVDRLLDLDHDSRIDQIERAARALGHELHIELRPAA
jgi:antitoxin HicB